MAKKIIVKEKKESLLQKLIMTVVSATVMALVAGVLGYKLNTRLPELYYLISEPRRNEKLYFVDILVVNYGRASATDLIIRYSFDRPIVYCDYSYSEALNGKLPADRMEGGVGETEFLLSIPRLLQEDELKAEFAFTEPPRSSVKVFSKEVLGRPFSEWQEKKNTFDKFWHYLLVVLRSWWYKFVKPYLNIPKIDMQLLLPK